MIYGKLVIKLSLEWSLLEMVGDVWRMTGVSYFEG